MDEKDKHFIEELFVKQTEQFQQYIGIMSENFDHKLALVAEGHQMLAEKLDRVDSGLDLKIDNVEKNLSARIDGVAADLKATDKRLSDKIDSVEKNLTQHISAVSTDLKAHRADTEAHHGGVYLVKES